MRASAQTLNEPYYSALGASIARIASLTCCRTGTPVESDNPTDESQSHCHSPGYARLWNWDGHAPPWGVETPNRVKTRLPRCAMDSLTFAVGEPATYVQAPKAKGRRNRTLFGFPTPRSRVYRAVCGGVPQTFSHNELDSRHWSWTRRQMKPVSNCNLLRSPRFSGTIDILFRYAELRTAARART